jgi:itaconyl-CoA hydratase
VTVKEGWRGRYFEDFEVGDVYQHPLGRSITETDNTWFSLLTMNTNQIHFNNDFSARTPFGQTLVNSGLTLAIVLGQSVTDISQTAIANLGWDDVRLPNPVFVGDTIYAESQVLEKRESKTRPYAGIVTCATRGLNQDGKTVVSWRRTIMVYKRAAPHDKEYFPVAVDGPFSATTAEG